jgi:XTP/dITP diphosphohydrolase
MISIVTWNSWKYKQIASVLEEGGFLVEQKKIDLIEPQSNDMLEVSKYKAKQAFEIIWKPVVVDDTGIYFDAYPNFPGVFSKYMMESLGMDGMRRLFQDQTNTRASFQCIVSYMDETLPEPVSFVGKSYGHLDFSFLDQVVRDHHLPYLSIFIPDGMDTVAQMNPSYFESNHHRVQAIKMLTEFLRNR